jgi:hypothetical protein
MSFKSQLVLFRSSHMETICGDLRRMWGSTAGSTREPMQEAIERFEEEATEGLK